MKSNRLISLFALLFAVSAWSAPQRLILTNQFGEQSWNYVQGQYLPLPGTTYNLIMASGVITPTAATLVNVASTGSLYINRNPAQNGSAKLFMNIGTITAPSWKVIGP